jgi:rare lipoprotein A
MLSQTRFDLRVALVLLCTLALAACGGRPTLQTGAAPPPVERGPVPDSPVKVGKPYQIAGIWYYPADDATYDEVGYASWYGDAFHGGPTANGERFDMHMVGAAHKTLPLPSYVEVTALDTGRTVLLRVNDRGPFVANRIIDLSHRAAEQLGITRQGVARVRVRRVYPGEGDKLALRSGRAAAERPVQSSGALAALDRRFQSWLVAQARPVVVAMAPVPTPAVVASAATPASAPFSASGIGGFFVQIGAYGDRLRADSLASQLGASIDTAGSVYRVRLGPYFDEGIALAALARVQGQGYQGARLIRPTATN